MGELRIRPLLVAGNTKLGMSIFHFDLPAIGTCPGSTELCRRVCYASQGRYLLSSVKERLDWNYKMSKRCDFADQLAEEIRRKGCLVIRPHCSGDFYSAEYAKQWLSVMKRCPQTRFYFYTRSYRVPEIAEVLEQMAALSNVRVWYSMDCETEVPERVPAGVRLAYLQIEEGEKPEVLDLLFVVRKLRREAQRMSLPLLCPHEADKAESCGACQKCFR